MFSRRGFLEGTTAICFGSAMGGLLSSVIGPGQALARAPESDGAAFIRLSRHLTGFEDLNEDLAAHFASHLAKSDPSGWRATIDSFKELSQAGREAPVQDLLQALQSSETTAAFLKRITKLWYSGWTEPAPDVPVELRAEAYREALAWRAMNLTPRGIPTARLWQAAAN